MGTHPIFESDFDCLTECNDEPFCEHDQTPGEHETRFVCSSNRTLWSHCCFVTRFCKFSKWILGPAESLRGWIVWYLFPIRSDGGNLSRHPETAFFAKKRARTRIGETSYCANN